MTDQRVAYLMNGQAFCENLKAQNTETQSCNVMIAALLVGTVAWETGIG